VRDSPLRRGRRETRRRSFGPHRITGRTFTGTDRYKNAKLGELERWDVVRST